VSNDAQHLARDFASGIRALMDREDGQNIIGHAWSQEKWLAVAGLLESFAQSETREISAGGAHDLRLHGTHGVTGSIFGLTVHVDPDVPDGTIIIRDELGRELGRIINVGR
jgi:hypothetical protein